MLKWTARPPLDWDALRQKIAQDGMRNSNCVAIAPATISNIIGVDASIEPSFGNLSVKSNLSGEFTVINGGLVRDLKRLGLWDDVMIMDLKHFKRVRCTPSTVCLQISRRCIPRRLKSNPPGWWKPLRADKVDRPGAEPEHLHGWRFGQEARRHLQTGMGARPQDHVLLRTQSATHVK